MKSITKVHAQDILDSLEDGEPVFVLRGRDALANFCVRHWINIAIDHGVNAVKVGSAVKVLEEFKNWRNTDKIKVPD